MTPETAYIKLAWLLSNYKDKVKELYGKNLRGEISERSENIFIQ
jgi:glutamyl-tRNA(Gln) amidotransferase subunit D